MDENERLREKFRTLVDDLGGRKPGIAEICRRFSEADDLISPKYLDQIYVGFQGKADQRPRAPGRELIKRLEKNLGLPPRWFYVDDTYGTPTTATLTVAEPIARSKTPFEVADVLKKSIEAMLDVWGVSPKDLFSPSADAQQRVIGQISLKMRRQVQSPMPSSGVEIRATEVALDATPPLKRTQR